MSKHKRNRSGLIPADPEYMETRKILTGLLKGMLEDLKKNSGARFRFFWDSRNDMAVLWKRSQETSEILRDLKTRQVLNSLSPKARSMSKLLSYLGLVESLGVTMVDIALLVLIANGREMHVTRGPGIVHVSRIKELRRLDLAYKLHFLESNKLNYFSKLIDRGLRNDIAHLKFEIGEDGTIRKSDRNVVNIDEVISNFWARVYAINSLLDDVGLKVWLGKKATE